MTSLALSDLERAAIASIDPGRIADDLTSLVRIPSITGREEEVQLEVVRLLEAADIAVERITPTPQEAEADPDWPGAEMPRASLPIVLGRLGRAGGRRVVLVGHVDVVPPGDRATWSVDPFGADIQDGMLYGRGACDMKGGVAAILEAARVIRSVIDRTTVLGELVLAFVPSEEDGGQGMLAAIRAGVTGDVAIITEPTGLEVVVAHAGAITFRLTVPGRAAHASVRREGVSALDKLYVLLEALAANETERNAAEQNPLMSALGLPYPTIVGKVSGGDWASTVLDRVVAEGRYGVRLGQTWRDAEVELRACISEAWAADPFLRDHPVALEIVGGRFSSSSVPEDHPLPVGVADVAEAVLGRRPSMMGEPYGADMRLLVNEGGTPTVIFGPGDIRVAHSADERVSLDEVADCARVLAVWLLRELAKPA
ncbi:MAG TPA: ArgE/DapE family deacylase [Candidatus Limnocylindrales bacterium]